MNKQPMPDLGQFVDYVFALKTERDALAAECQRLRELLRKVAPHFAAPPGLGYLHAEIDAALAGSKEGGI